MKKKLSVLLLLCVVCAASVLGACGIFGKKEPVHTHSYTKMVTTDAYLRSSATCTKKATYYYSCECGERSTATFEYGRYGDHTYSTEWSSDESKHWHASTCVHNVRKDEEPHNFEENICTRCKYKKVIEDKVIDVSSITLNKSELSIRIGESADLIATVLPDNATDKTVIWSSSSPSVATVDDGRVNAIAKGSAIITATVGKLSATCAIEVVGDFLFTPMGNGYAVSAYIGENNIATVPDTYNEKSVTMIGERAFYDCSKITEIILPSSIKEIGVEAFGYCISLTKIKIAACTRLKDKAFIRCQSCLYGVE